ncbi:MAG: LacI family DNA-binding transcriptional regulator [Pedobacter sp.]|uniref:LacI family DNA-binding transcriptional regulator n=1 Tax=Pedobacter sp. TaxID=1411316 RepID=UPI0028078488|nr:LacI family DNA-binding transcriptional regulator [Pedobacter sp.]MDQ8003436.1 LacI family DNA-binding transcriptional regulator [Pedobacter sp.]
MSNITLRDISKALNISVSTVSRALTDSHEIGEETKKLVLAYAKEHNYVPNRMARSLKVGKTRSIGVVICSIDNNFVAQMLDGIDQICTESGYQIIIMQSKESYEQEKACINLLYASGVDGIMISPSLQTTDFTHLKELQSQGFPIVLFDRTTEELTAHKITANNIKGAYQATTHLILSGCTRIAHLNSKSTLAITRERFEGYKQALVEHQIAYEEDLVKFCNTSINENTDENVATAMEELLKQKPQAIFTATDLLSTKALAYLNKHGYKVPDDLSLIGFSNSDLAPILNPPLSTVRQPSRQIGELAAQTIINLVKGKDIGPAETVLLDTELQIRKSSSR